MTVLELDRLQPALGPAEATSLLLDRVAPVSPRTPTATAASPGAGPARARRGRLDPTSIALRPEGTRSITLRL